MAEAGTFETLQRVLIGSPLRTEQVEHQRLNKIRALAVFSSDALSSVAYATEEILLVLVGGGLVTLSYSVPIATTIVVLLVIVVLSYAQTIKAYPSGAGSYLVSKDNLGIQAGLVAAAALLLDYILTVAVSISAGVVAITSAFPDLLAHRVSLCLLFLIFIAIANLRGAKESGTLFAIPTYLFIVVLLTLIFGGIFQISRGALHPLDITLPVEAGAGGIGVLLILRAFSSGCTALTGIEAISNGVPAFREPAPVNARITLSVLAVLLTSMFLGITYLAWHLHIVPVAEQSVVSQIGRLVFGNTWLYFALQFFTMFILVLAANTSFADFPRLSSLIARDGYLPRQLTNLGDRLVYSNGIIMLAVLAGFLMIFFQGNPHQLIPLYAVGVFLSFTLSQIGMVIHWFRTRERGWRWKLVINGIGGVVTGVVTAIIAESKFIYGAWTIILLLPVLVYCFHKIKHHYLIFEREVVVMPTDAVTAATIFAAPTNVQHKVVVPVSVLNKATINALQFARSLSNDVRVITVNVDPIKTQALRHSWTRVIKNIDLVVVESPYRSVLRPIIEYLERLDSIEPERGKAVVVLPEILPKRWWQHLLHNQTALMIKGSFLLKPQEGGSERVVIDVPYRLSQ